MNVEALLQQTGGAGKHTIRRGGGDDNQIDVVLADASGVHRIARRLLGQVDGVNAIGRNVALLDTGALANPFIAGIDLFFQVFVGDDVIGQITSGTGYFCKTQTAFSSRGSIRVRICSGTAFSISITAISIALA